jgi:hypothetical protein
MHSWYAKLLSTGFPGKLIVMYVHEPSLLTVLTKGKTINATISQFHERLHQLMQRINFKPAFIETEMEMVREGYVVSKTNNKSMLASMNVLTFNMEFNCRGFPDYESINLDYIEDIYTDWLTMDKQSNRYHSIMDYWKERNVVLL